MARPLAEGGAVSVNAAAADLALWTAILLIVLALIFAGPVIRLRRLRRYNAMRLAGYRGMWPPPPSGTKYPPLPPPRGGSTNQEPMAR